MSAQEIVLCKPVRTAIGTFNGALKAVPATDLGATVVRETLKRAGVDAAQIGSVIMGNVIQAGNKMNSRAPGRNRRRRAGVGSCHDRQSRVWLWRASNCYSRTADRHW